MKRRLAMIVLALACCGCAARFAVLKDAPKPGLAGTAKYDVQDQSTDEFVSFVSTAAEAEIRAAFGRYCQERGLVKSARRQAFSTKWYESKREALGILLSPDAGGRTMHVTYFRSSAD